MNLCESKTQRAHAIFIGSRVMLATFSGHSSSWFSLSVFRRCWDIEATLDPEWSLTGACAGQGEHVVYVQKHTHTQSRQSVKDSDHFIFNYEYFSHGQLLFVCPMVCATYCNSSCPWAGFTLSNEADSGQWHTARPVETHLWFWWAAAHKLSFCSRSAAYLSYQFLDFSQGKLLESAKCQQEWTYYSKL